MRELREGDSIGPYVLERAIDRGAFGRVWRGTDTTTGRTVAVKVLASSADEEHVRARTDLERLAAAAARDSRHIVRVVGGGHEPVPHIVMEFVAGTNLRDELAARGALPQEEVIRIGLEIADALRALHRVRIVHRDVKPANILLDEKGEVRLTDFGIAKILGYDETVTLTQQNLLSAPYAAPEVWEGAPNPSSDLYAFGAVLFEMLSGRPPFQGDLMELFRQHRSDEPDLSVLPANVAPSLKELVYQCLRKVPGERPEGAEACIRLLERAREELKPEPEQFGPWVRVEPHPEQPWAWRCVHERTGEPAVVEVHFAQDEAYGEALRAAVNVNPRLVPLGAERLLGANRLLLKDNEGWPSAPEHNLVFWVAREERQPPDPAEELDTEALLKATETLLKMIEVAAGSVRLTIDSHSTVVAQDGAVWVQRPGLPPAPRVEPRLAAFIFLRSLPLTPEANEIANRARDLRDLRERLARPWQEAASAGARRREGRTLALVSGLLVFGITVAVLAAFALAGTDFIADTPPAGSPTPDAAVTYCGSLRLPAPLAEARAACASAPRVDFELSQDCARGHVCTIEARGDGVVLKANDQTIVFVDTRGDLAVAREGSFQSRTLLPDSGVRHPAWSPDGRYLAYVISRPTVEGEQRELWVMDMRDTAVQAQVFVSRDGPEVPEWRRRRISHPQWSANGHRLYFFWNPASGAEDLWAIDLPVRGDEVDLRELRMWNGTAANLGVLRPPAESFRGLQLTSFSAAPDGALLTEFCVPDAACGLARWHEGGFDVIAQPQQGARFIAPTQAGGRTYALTIDGSDVVLLEVDPSGLTRGRGRAPASVAGLEPNPNDLSLSISPDGATALIGTAAGISRLDLATAATTPVLEGRWGRWFVPRRGDPATTPPSPMPFATPVLSPTVPPTATIPPGADADLTGEVVAATCAMGQTLVVRVTNLGPGLVERDVFIRVATLDGQTRQGDTNVGLVGLRPGESREVRTAYNVGEPVQVLIQYTRDRRPENNTVICRPPG
ncbi:MAG TPA: protein kinase [Dehalococcoidia bacterium]|nr:protein kinase [Dehalococcoidia bacterium]